MSENVHEASVITVYDQRKRRTTIWRIKWQGRVYQVTTHGYHYTLEQGSTLCHIFSVVAGSLLFRLKFNTRTLQWSVEETYDNC